MKLSQFVKKVEGNLGEGMKCTVFLYLCFNLLNISKTALPGLFVYVNVCVRGGEQGKF